MRDFQYRFLHRGLLMNKQLKEWKILEQDLCMHCGRQTESMVHFFVDCDVAKDMWDKYKEYCMNMFGVEVNVTPVAIVTNEFISPIRHVTNAICLFLKQYLYKQRCTGKAVSFAQFEKYVVSMKNTEKYIAIRDKKNRMLL